MLPRLAPCHTNYRSLIFVRYNASGRKGRVKNLIAQFMKFGVVGVIAFFIDYGLLAFCTEILHFNYLVSAFGISGLGNFQFERAVVDAVFF